MTTQIVQNKYFGHERRKEITETHCFFWKDVSLRSKLHRPLFPHFKRGINRYCPLTVERQRKACYCCTLAVNGISLIWRINKTFLIKYFFDKISVTNDSEIIVIVSRRFDSIPASFSSDKFTMHVIIWRLQIIVVEAKCNERRSARELKKHNAT